MLRPQPPEISQRSLTPRSSARDGAASADLKTHIKYMMIPPLPVTHADDSINLKTAAKFNFPVNPAIPCHGERRRQQQPARLSAGPEGWRGEERGEGRKRGARGLSKPFVGAGGGNMGRGAARCSAHPRFAGSESDVSPPRRHAAGGEESAHAEPSHLLLFSSVRLSPGLR